jgi:hypothetical protein
VNRVYAQTQKKRFLDYFADFSSLQSFFFEDFSPVSPLKNQKSLQIDFYFEDFCPPSNLSNIQMILYGKGLELILRQRKPAKELSLKRRHTNGFKLTANDQVKVEKSLNTIRTLLKIKLLRPDVGDKVNKAIRFLTARHLLLTHTVDRKLDSCRPDLKRTINSWKDDECEMDFRFDKDLQLRLNFECEKGTLE